jgi:hypothetical protein
MNKPLTDEQVPLEKPEAKNAGLRPADDPEQFTDRAITGKYNYSPVGDVELKKAKGSYNTYTLKLSMGQLEVIMAALEQNHDDPVSDELFATFQYYIDKLPGPGEEEEDLKARERGAVETGAQTTGDVEDEDVPIPMPPGGEGEPAPEEPPAGPEEAPEGGPPGERPPPPAPEEEKRPEDEEVGLPAPPID